MTTGFLPPVIDAEAAGDVLGKTEYSAWINAFSDEIFRLSGVRPIVYANINYAVNFIDESVASRHKLWLARYNGGNDPSTVDPQTSQPELASFHPNPYGSWNVPVGGARSDDSWRFWQYTSMGDGPAFGVSSTFLDLDLYNGSLDELRKEFLIGFQKNFGTTNNNPFAVGNGITTIQAEDYDIGGADISYSDTTPDNNTAAAYRTSKREGVDVAPIVLGTNTFRVTSTAPGEYIEYTIDVAESGGYQLDYYLAQTAAGGAFHVEIDGQALPVQAVPNTGNSTKFVPVSQETTLSAGTHVVRLAFDTAASNGNVTDIDRIAFTKIPAVQSNFGTENNAPFAVGPGITTTIEAENYDIGGPNLSYVDLTSNQNTGDVYRSSTREGVDLGEIAAGTGAFRVTDTEAGEYVEYTIDVSDAGSYLLDYHLSQTDVGGRVHAEIDGVALSTLAVPDTEDLNSFSPVSQIAALSAGQHVLRFSFDTASAANGRVGDLDKIIITQAPAQLLPSPPPLDAPVADGAAHVRGGFLSGQNFAFSRELVVQRGRGAANTAFSFLRFDLNSVASIASARLRLVGRLSDSAVSSLTTNVSSAGPKQQLTEGAINYKKKLGAKKLRGAITVTGTTNSVYELDLTSFLQSELAAGRKVVTLVLKNVTRSVTTQTIFASDESANPPALVLT
jgi:hypothetical protein